jgi:hypothetical protein
VILAIHKFYYFNLVVSLLHCNHQYHADFDICHDLHSLIIGKHVPHLPVEVPSYIISHQARTTIHACLNKKCKYVFAKRIKGRPAQKLPPTMVSGHCCRTTSTHLRCRDDATILDIIVVERARYGEYRSLLARLPNEVHPGLISEDSPVNFSRTPSANSRERPLRPRQPGAPDTVRCTTGQSGAPDRSSLLAVHSQFFSFSSCFQYLDKYISTQNQCTKT